MGPAGYLRRGGLTSESSSTFSSLGLSSCWRSVPLITAAHRIHKKDGNALNAPISRESLMNQHCPRGPTCQQHLQEGSCSYPVVNTHEKGRPTEECKKSIFSTETNGSVSLAIQVPTKGEPSPSTLNSALARNPLSHLDVVGVPSTPKHVAGEEPSATSVKKDGECLVVTAGFNHNFGCPVFFFRL